MEARTESLHGPGGPGQSRSLLDFLVRVALPWRLLAVRCGPACCPPLAPSVVHRSLLLAQCPLSPPLYHRTLGIAANILAAFGASSAAGSRLTDGTNGQPVPTSSSLSQCLLPLWMLLSALCPFRSLSAAIASVTLVSICCFTQFSSDHMTMHGRPQPPFLDSQICSPSAQSVCIVAFGFGVAWRPCLPGCLLSGCPTCHVLLCLGFLRPGR